MESQNTHGLKHIIVGQTKIHMSGKTLNMWGKNKQPAGLNILNIKHVESHTIHMWHETHNDR